MCPPSLEVQSKLNRTHEIETLYESALRIKGRLLICGLLVFGLGWAALYLSKAGDYSTWATVWVEKPLYLDTDLASNPYVTPPQFKLIS